MTVWHNLLKSQAGPLLLPAAHDALTAMLIDEAGFPAYQIGGFALAASDHGTPDLDLQHLGERELAVRRITAACRLPVLVDADDGYGDEKNVTHTVRTYARLGVAALFIEDQEAPKRCGHLGPSQVVPLDVAARKVAAAAAAALAASREWPGSPRMFILARTDALGTEGMGGVRARGTAYLDAGADGLYVEGPDTKQKLEEAAALFPGVPLAVSILEPGGKTPWLPPADLGKMGYGMLLYPSSVIFRAAFAARAALNDLRAGRRPDIAHSYDLGSFERLLRLGRWEALAGGGKG